MLFSPRKWVTKYFCYEVITQEKASVFCWTDIGLTYSSDPVVTQCWIYSSLIYSRHLHSGAPERLACEPKTYFRSLLLFLRKITCVRHKKTVISVPFLPSRSVSFVNLEIGNFKYVKFVGRLPWSRRQFTLHLDKFMYHTCPFGLSGCHMIYLPSWWHFIYLFITIYGLRKNKRQRVKCKRVKDPILKQIT